MADVARSMGMVPRVDNGFLSRVYCEGPDVATVHENLSALEAKF